MIISSFCIQSQSLFWTTKHHRPNKYIQKNYESLDQEQHLLKFCQGIHDRLLYFSKNFYTFGFAEIDMDIKSLRAFSQHIRFYPEVLDELI